MSSEMSRAPSVLVVDDEADVRQLAADILHQAGFGIFEAADGREALGVLGAAGPIDLLLTDIRMPGIDGFELAASALRLYPDLKALFMTGYTVQPPDASTLLLRKPFCIHQLITAVQIALGRGRFGQIGAYSPRGA